jgi:hypothetical protein
LRATSYAIGSEYLVKGYEKEIDRMNNAKIKKDKLKSIIEYVPRGERYEVYYVFLFN